MKVDISDDSQVILAVELTGLVEILEFLEFYEDKLTVSDVKQILTDRVFDIKELLCD